MKKIISIILSLLMTLLGSFFPGLFAGKDAAGMSQGEWIAALVVEFGMDQSEYSDVPYYEGITAEAVGEELFAAVQIAFEWKIIDEDDTIKLDDAVTNAFIYKTLMRALSNIDISDIGLLNNKKKADAAAAYAWLAEAKEVWLDRDYSKAEKADVVVNAAGEVEAVDIEGTITPDLNKATVYGPNGELIQEAPEGGVNVADVNWAKDLLDQGIDYAKGYVKDFLANPSISFSAGDVDIKAAYSGGRVSVGIAGNVADGVRIEKYWDLTNINFDTKYDANLAALKVKEAYVVMNYDLVETTVLTGSYAASVVPASGSFSNEGSFLDQVKANLKDLTLVKGGGIKVDIFNFTYPVGPTGITLKLTISLTISAQGRVEIIVSSNETKGYEIINNKGRYISETTILDRLYNITGDFSIVLGLNFSIGVFGITLIDVDVKAGIGAYVQTKITNFRTNMTYNVEVPIDIALEVTTELESLADLKFTGYVELYGILRISVGENSILASIGLKKAWTIFDRSNGVFAKLEFDNDGIRVL